MYEPNVMGDIIRGLRNEKNLSQEVLSGLAGIGRSHLAMIENGSKTANVETLSRIASALDISMSQLFIIYEQSTSESDRVLHAAEERAEYGEGPSEE